MNILICDDKKDQSDTLKRILLETGLPLNINVFGESQEVIKQIQNAAHFDICFLDIIMPNIDGIALAEKLRGLGFSGEIVFLTTSNEYAAESYSVDAFSYMLKPATSEKIARLLNKIAARKMQEDSAGIWVKIPHGRRFLQFKDICTVEVVSHYIYFKLTTGEEVKINSTFSETGGLLLENERFMQCHRSYIVNLAHIIAIAEKDITMRNNEKIPISKSYSDVKKKFVKWVTGGQHDL